MKNIIKVNNTAEGFQILQINNQSFDPSPDLSYQLSQNLIGKMNIMEFPLGERIAPFEEDFLGFFKLQKIPIIIRNNGNGIALLEIEACRELSYQGDSENIEYFQNRKVEHILKQKTVNPRIDFFKTVDLTNHLHYIIELPADVIEKLVDYAIKFDEDANVSVENSMKKV